MQTINILKGLIWFMFAAALIIVLSRLAAA